MNWMAQHWLALALLVGYTGMLFYNAYLGNKVSRGMPGYYVGNREMNGIVVGYFLLCDLCLDQYLHRARRQSL